jgi:hypothetical protein
MIAMALGADPYSVLVEFNRALNDWEHCAKVTINSEDYDVVRWTHHETQGVSSS